MKSVITCDLEGKILTMTKGAENLFGYSKEELINKKRVSLFSPGEIVLQNVSIGYQHLLKKVSMSVKRFLSIKIKKK